MNIYDVRKIWNDLEKQDNPPKFVSKINLIEFSTLKGIVDNKNLTQVKYLIRCMYEGQAFIVRGAAPKSLKNVVLALTEEYNKGGDSSFHKMLDGSPNFHRIIDHDITQKYSLYAIKHSYYLYNWNRKFKLESVFANEVYRHWRYIKFLAGNTKKAYEKNIPSDGQIDRLQIVNYPHGGGQLRDHEDPRKNQRVVSGLIMSKRGVDFDSGGFYFRGINNQIVNIEDRLEVGDSVMFYGSIIHGVEPIDPHRRLDWRSREGRWFVGMFVNDSDHVDGRITARDLTRSTNFKVY